MRVTAARSATAAHVLSPAGRMRVTAARSAPAAHVLSPAGRMRVTAARSAPAAHVLPPAGRIVSQRPGVRPLRVYCSRCGCYHGVNSNLTS
ncbi:hypothetical protein MTE1_4377 [Klebsiella pneumoniae JHCK1]|nr:hypothetical protein MTE1_4377 [Klebsiella pneumoniae JHCK1]